jgi:hypothetical protein
MATAITALSSSRLRRQHDKAQPQHSKCDEESISPDKPDSATDDPVTGQDRTPTVSSLLKTTLLRSSPYAGPEHLLDLDNLETQNRLMALALTCFSPARPDYAITNYQQAFDWDQVIALLTTLAEELRITWKKQSFYVVEFRSKLKENIDHDRLYLLDKQSHMEATASGGLLKYWYGSPDYERYNLATCKDFPGHQLFLHSPVTGLWRSKEDAVNGGRGPWHKQARDVIPQMYEMIQVKGLSLSIDDGIKSWDIST